MQPDVVRQLAENLLKAHVAFEAGLTAISAHFAMMANWDDVGVAEAKCSCGNVSSCKIRQGVRPIPNDSDEYKVAYEVMSVILKNTKIPEPYIGNTPCSGCGRHHAYWMISRKS